MAGKLLVLISLVTWLMGCATALPPDVASTYESQLTEIRKVALVADPEPPKIESVDLGHTHAEGMLGGGALGAGGGAAVSLQMAPATMGVSLLFLPVFMGVGAAVGGVGGAVTGISPEELAHAEASAQAMLNAGYLQKIVLQRAQDYGIANAELEFIQIPGVKPNASAKNQAYQNLTEQSIDMVLEVKLVKIELERTLEIEARARAISTRTGEVQSAGAYRFVSGQHSRIEWLENGAATLLETVEQGLHTVAENIVDEKFLLYYPKKAENKITGKSEEVGSNEQHETKPRSKNTVPYYVLSPIYPELDRCLFCGAVAIGGYKFVEVDSAQPVLRWESFPRSQDLIETNGVTNRVTDVRYDLRVFETTTPSNRDIPKGVLVPGHLVYDARGLSESYHKIEKVLNLCTNHFWTVRARFKLDGRVRVTEWAGFFMGFWNAPWELRRGTYSKGAFALSPAIGPEAFYYPFKTLCS